MYLLELAVQGLINGSMYALMALGLTLIYGLLRVLHIAHAAVFTLGAYVAVVTANATGSLWLACQAALLASGVAGVAICRFIYMPLHGRPPVISLIASVGLLICLQDGFRIVFGDLGIPFASNELLYRTITVGDVSIGVLQVAMVATAVLLLSGFAAFISLSRTGVAWRATLSDPRMATSFGISVTGVRYLNFAVGSVLAGMAGMMVALLNNSAEPEMGMVVSYKALAVIVLGGLGSMRGALAGSLLLGLVESFGTVSLGGIMDRDAIAAICLIVVLLLRPHGLSARAPA